VWPCILHGGGLLAIKLSLITLQYARVHTLPGKLASKGTHTYVR
jgi:hypothetical protein